MSTVQKIILGNNASMHYQKWWIQFSASLSTQFLGPRGLLEINYHLTDAQYDNLPHAVDAGGAPIIPNVRPTFTIEPLVGTAAQIAALKQNNSKAEAINMDMSRARTFTIETAGPDVTDEVSAPDTGLTMVTLHQLLHHIQANYGVLTAANVSVLRASLDRWDGSKSVKANLIAYQQSHLVLANAGYAVNEDIKISSLAEATRTNMAIQDVFKLYRTEQPVLLQQTYAALKAKIILLEPGFTITHAGYAAANAALALTQDAARKMELHTAVEEALATQNKEFQKLLLKERDHRTKDKTAGGSGKPKFSSNDVYKHCQKNKLCRGCYKRDNTDVAYATCKEHNLNAP